MSTRIGVPEGDVANLNVAYYTDFGHDCDGNCCYDVLMMDSYGDGWNGAELQVFQGFSLVDTLTLSDGSSGWGSFCVDANMPYFFSFDDSTQTYDDGETFVAMQGNNSGGSDTVCSIGSDLDGSGIVTDCAPSNGGVLYCQ